ncbi:hypothetical protein [Flavobacterium sp. WC2509]|uniref:hypothetical protein n=1 Tax=Flavobacterium sp. WC2509 TaxID=3461406 RepID=UPI004045042F
MSVPAVLIRKSTKEIIKQASYPRADMLPVEGLDPDYEWLVKNIPYPEPDYDSRIFIMQTNLPDLAYLDSFQEHPLYSGVREYRITYSPVKRPNDDIIRAIENAEKEANQGVFPETIHKDEFSLMLSSVRKDAKNLELTNAEQIKLEQIDNVAVKISKNKDTASIKIEQVMAGQEPNIDEGWERNQ